MQLACIASSGQFSDGHKPSKKKKKTPKPHPRFRAENVDAEVPAAARRVGGVTAHQAVCVTAVHARRWSNGTVECHATIFLQHETCLSEKIGSHVHTSIYDQTYTTRCAESWKSYACTLERMKCLGRGEIRVFVHPANMQNEKAVALIRHAAQRSQRSRTGQEHI